jgi:hypothetical protein
MRRFPLLLFPAVQFFVTFRPGADSSRFWPGGAQIKQYIKRTILIIQVVVFIEVTL